MGGILTIKERGNLPYCQNGWPCMMYSGIWTWELRYSALLQMVGGDKLIIPFADGLHMNPFKGRHFQRDIILWAVRWYCKYGISYRELQRCWLNAE